MELVDGVTLSDYMVQFLNLQVPEPECQIILRQVMHAIKYFHSKGIVHRDLKLDNILLTGTDTGDIRDLRVKLIDFGMSKHTTKGNKKINLSSFCGTIDFIAPEIFEGIDYDERCDYWSIGVIAFFLLSGTPPFQGKNEDIVKNKILTCNFSFDDEAWERVS